MSLPAKLLLNPQLMVAPTTANHIVNKAYADALGGMNVRVTGVSITLANRDHAYATAGGLTITLPAAPSAGNRVIISGGDFVTTVVGRNGQNIMALAENMTIDKAGSSVTLEFVDAIRGWVIV